MNEIYQWIKGRDSEILYDIERLVKKESPTLEKKFADLCREEIQKLFADHLNAQPKIYEDDKFGNHLRYQFGESDSQILITCHYDTVWDQGELSYYVDGNKAFGPGILDMKGGLVIAIWALKALKELDIPLKNKKVVFFCNSDHEGVASPHSRKIIEYEAKKSDVVLVPEASASYTNALKTERKGILRYKIHASGKAAHAGNNPEDGVNAIVELANQVRFLDGLTDYSLGTTVNAGRIKGGTGVNVVADQAELDIDVRVKSMQEANRIKEIIESLKPYNDKATIHIEGGIVRPSMEKTEQTEKLFAIAKNCGSKFGYEVQEASVGGGSDGSFAAALGIPTLDGLGAAGVGPHAKEEHILIDHLSKRVALFANLLSEIDQSWS
ncbi:glutamate carboxypeptidase [Kroppenstedtia sanguinis]|uniref:M20 family metallopeptidase n=1 Tax=Kroppenstedtia sanguinis TaxID=1380684 RepID=A0ABW4C998_9BACL